MLKLARFSLNSFEVGGSPSAQGADTAAERPRDLLKRSGGQANVSDVPVTKRFGANPASLGQVDPRHAYLTNPDKDLARIGIGVAAGFSTTDFAYRRFINEGDLEWRIGALLDGLDVEDLPSLREASATIRGWILKTPLPRPFADAVGGACAAMGMTESDQVPVSLRVFGPERHGSASQQVLLNVRGTAAVIGGVKTLYATLFDGRAIAERSRECIDHLELALRVDVRLMVRSDTGVSGTLLTRVPAAGTDDLVIIDACYGLNPNPIEDEAHPDRVLLRKADLAAGRPAIAHRTLGTKTVKVIFGHEADTPVRSVPVPDSDRSRYCLTDAQLEDLGRQALRIERHFGGPVRVEWALDGASGHWFVVDPTEIVCAMPPGGP